MKITLHHDAPVAGIDILNVVSSAVNRRTTSGKLLGPGAQSRPTRRSRAVTKDAAWQYFEEDRKGTLEVGKLADLVVLSENPLTIDPMKISSIRWWRRSRKARPYISGSRRKSSTPLRVARIAQAESPAVCASTTAAAMLSRHRGKIHADAYASASGGKCSRRWASVATQRASSRTTSGEADWHG